MDKREGRVLTSNGIDNGEFMGDLRDFVAGRYLADDGWVIYAIVEHDDV